jgi:hypothetical protein
MAADNAPAPHYRRLIMDADLLGQILRSLQDDLPYPVTLGGVRIEIVAGDSDSEEIGLAHSGLAGATLISEDGGEL